MKVQEIQRATGRRCWRALKANESSWHSFAFYRAMTISVRLSHAVVKIFHHVIRHAR